MAYRTFHAIVPLFAAVLLSCCALLAPPEPARVAREMVDPPAAAIVERTLAYAAADASLSLEDLRQLQIQCERVQAALEGPEPILVSSLAPLASGMGAIYAAYERYTLADTSLEPATAQGRVLAARLLSEAIHNFLDEPAEE